MGPDRVTESSSWKLCVERFSCGWERTWRQCGGGVGARQEMKRGHGGEAALRSLWHPWEFKGRKLKSRTEHEVDAQWGAG